MYYILALKVMAIATDIRYYTVIPDSKVHGANMGSTWGRQAPGGPRVGPMAIAIWDRAIQDKYHITFKLATQMITAEFKTQTKNTLLNI